jgi:hypothetical protein
VSNRESASLPAHARHLCLITLFALVTGAATASAQAVPPVSPYYARTNTFSIFSAYSGDSSHILLGSTENRKLLDFGVAYGHKLYLNHIVNWQYNGELLPVALESDPEFQLAYHQTYPSVRTYDMYILQATGHCVSGGSGTYTMGFGDVITSSGTFTTSCTRRWTMGEGISPVGFQWNFLPRNKLQPFFIGHGGYMYSTQPIPVPEAGSFNFTFDFGAGFELYRSMTRSVRAEYRIHHISNHGTADQNPGIDSGLFQLTYSFGR